MIELEHVYKQFGGRQVLSDVSFEIRRGETFVIIGRSGVGKTVILKHISGLLDPDRGSVSIDGTTISHSSNRVKRRLRLRMGVVFQNGALLNWMSVAENLALPLVEARRYSRREIEERVDDRLHLLGLSEAKHRMPSDLSGGMKKRVSLARVLVTDPDIILYDEPTTELDPIMCSVINQLVVRMQRELGVTSVVVTHDMNSAYTIADRIAVLYNGRIIQCDSPERIRNSDNPVVQQFITGGIDGPIQVE